MLFRDNRRIDGGIELRSSLLNSSLIRHGGQYFGKVPQVDERRRYLFAKE
jgi:hypothetical protein